MRQGMLHCLCASSVVPSPYEWLCRKYLLSVFVLRIVSLSATTICIVIALSWAKVKASDELQVDIFAYLVVLS